MAVITLIKAIKTFEREISGLDRDDYIDEITTAIEFVLFNGGGEILREWDVVARNGKFTLPKDLNVPIKYKFLNSPVFGTFYSSYLSYSSNSVKNYAGYNEWDSKIEVRANRVPTQFDLPVEGARLVYTTKNTDDVGKKIMVAGKQRGREISSTYEGIKTAGEILTLQLECDDQKKYSSFIFDEITHIVRDATLDWTMLSGYNFNSKTPYFLSYFHPDEETPSYTQATFIHNAPMNGEFSLSILGKIDPSIRYTRDEDIIPIDSFEILKLAAQRAKYDNAKDLKEVAAYEQRIKTTIKRKIAYQQQAMRSLSIKIDGSGHSASNI